MPGSIDYLIVGDSLMKNAGVATWPELVARQCHAKAHNFAVPNTTTNSLSLQLEKAFSRREGSHGDPTYQIVFLGGGGNDLLSDLGTTMKSMKEIDNTTLQETICQNKLRIVKRLYENGVRFFVVTCVPFSTCIPAIKGLIQEHARMNNCDFEMSQAATKKLQCALTGNISDMLRQFQQEHPDMKFICFDEVKEIETWDVQESLFDATLMHPNEEGNAKLANAALALLPHDFPKGSAEDSGLAQVAPLSAAQLVEAPSNPPRSSRRRCETLMHSDSLEEQFQSAAGFVRELGLEDVSQAQMLTFYKLFKQATCGDNEAPHPGYFAYTASYKWKAWNEMKGTTQEAAMNMYVKEYERFISQRTRT